MESGLADASARACEVVALALAGTLADASASACVVVALAAAVAAAVAWQSVGARGVGSAVVARARLPAVRCGMHLARSGSELLSLVSSEFESRDESTDLVAVRVRAWAVVASGSADASARACAVVALALAGA